MKHVPDYPGRNTEDLLPTHAEQRPLPSEPASSFSYQLVTIAAAVLLVVSAAVLW